jgi:hypothetical protein
MHNLGYIKPQGKPSVSLPTQIIVFCAPHLTVNNRPGRCTAASPANNRRETLMSICSLQPNARHAQTLIRIVRTPIVVYSRPAMRKNPARVTTRAGFTHGDRRLKAVVADCAFVKPT